MLATIRPSRSSIRVAGRSRAAEQLGARLLPATRMIDQHPCAGGGFFADASGFGGIGCVDTEMHHIQVAAGE